MSVRLVQVPIFVLTLEGDEARRAPLLAKLADLGLNHELWYGIDGRAGLAPVHTSEIDREGARLTMRRQMTDGEFACALSHRSIYDEIIRRGIERAIVLEDDAIISPRLVDLAHQPAFGPANLLLLDHSHAWVWRRSYEILKDVEARTLALNCCLATGYALTLDGARALRQLATPVRSVADWPGDITRIGAAAVTPQLVDHPNAEHGVSHLRDHRDYEALGHSGPWRGLGLRRFLYLGYWKRWVRKRAALRIS